MIPATFKFASKQYSNFAGFLQVALFPNSGNVHISIFHSTRSTDVLLLGWGMLLTLSLYQPLMNGGAQALPEAQ